MRRVVLSVIVAGVVVFGVFAWPEGGDAQSQAAVVQKLQAAVAWQKAGRVEAERVVRWQRDMRHKRLERFYGPSVREIIERVAAREGVSAADMIAVGECESHLYPNAQNGQYKGVFQLSLRHRSDPLIQRFGWTDVWAVATHTAQYVKAHSWSEWECKPTGRVGW